MGRHHTDRRLPTSVRAVVAGAAALAVIAVVGVGAVKTFGDVDCAGTVTLDVAAATDIAPAIAAAARDWAGGEPKIGGQCVQVRVTAADPVDVASAIAAKDGISLGGLGEPKADVPVPQVWVPDSRSWMQRLRAVRPESLPPDAVSVASSPVVLAVPEPMTTSLGVTDARMSLVDVVKRITDRSVRFGIVEPGGDAAGVANLLALRAAAGSTGVAAQQTTVAVLRTLAANRLADRGNVLSRFPRSTDANALAAGVGAAVLPEQAVIAFNDEQPPVPLTAVHLDPAPPTFDYPYVVLPGLAPDTEAAAVDFRAALAGTRYVDELALSGLRAADGSTGAGFHSGHGISAEPMAPVGMPDPGVVDAALSTWYTVIMPSRLLVVLDVSGSMQAAVPTAGNLTREQVTVEATKRGLGLLDDTWAVGLWTFSTLLDGANDYQQLVPIGPMGPSASACSTPCPRSRRSPMVTPGCTTRCSPGTRRSSPAGTPTATTHW